MRLFLAIDVDDAARRAAAAWGRRMSTRMGAAAREIKWVETENLHLTLHFFGELNDAQLDAVRTAFAAPFATRAFDVALSGAGTFPPSGATRVIWLGIREQAGGAAMQQIYADVQSRLVPLALQEESPRGFTPHLTLGRVRTPSGTTTRAVREALHATRAPNTAFRIAHVTLYQSRLSPKGPTYQVIAQFPLAHG